MQQKLQQAFVVNSTREQVWRFFWDLETVAKCIPGCEEVRTLNPGLSYQARIRRSVGPFLIRFELQIAVVESESPQRIQVTVSGEDKRLRSEVHQNISILLSDLGDNQCQIEIITDFRLSGMLAALGETLLAGQIRQEIDTFVDCVKSLLKDPAAKAHC